MHSGPFLTPCGRYPEAGGMDIPEDIPEAFPVSLSLSSPLAEGVVMGARG